MDFNPAKDEDGSAQATFLPCTELHGRAVDARQVDYLAW